MRDRERRLQRVTTRMTVRQRVAALLAAGPGNTAVYDDIGRGLTPAGWAAFRRYADRLDHLNATVRACLAQAESEIDMLQWIAYRRITNTQLAILVESLQDALDGWQPRHGRAEAADRYLDGAARQVLQGLRFLMTDLESTAPPEQPCPPMDALLRDGFRNAHHLLRALAIEVAAFAAELDADPLDAALHAQADHCRTKLAVLIDGITLDPPIVLTEPSDATVAAVAARCRPEEDSEEASW